MVKPYCVICHIELPLDSRFCFRCGQSLAHLGLSHSHSQYLPKLEPAPAVRAPAKTDPSETLWEHIPEKLQSKFESARAAIASERKLVSIIFADISGFTAMSDKMDPEKVTDILNACFQRLGGLVYELEGYIDKFMGDCIMALFGAPIAHENDHELAIECGIRMLDGLEKFNQDMGLGLGMSIGINSGMVVAGGVGTDRKFDYTVMGDAVNIAQRLQAAAHEKQILVSKNIYKLSQQKFEFETLPPIKVKGKDAPLDVFSVTGRKKTEARDRPRGGYTKLIGRKKEMQIIEHLLDELSKKTRSVFGNFRRTWNRQEPNEA